MDSQSNPRRALKSVQEQEDRRRHRNKRDRAQHAAETVEQRSERLRSGGRGIVPGLLLKLPVKDKLPCSRKVPINAKEWQLKPRRREKWGYSECETDWKLKPLMRERLQQMSTNPHERLAVETPEKRELILECYSTRYMEQQSVQPQLPLFQRHSIQTKMNMQTWLHWIHWHAPLVQKDFWHTCTKQ